MIDYLETNRLILRPWRKDRSDASERQSSQKNGVKFDGFVNRRLFNKNGIMCYKPDAK